VFYNFGFRGFNANEIPNVANKNLGVSKKVLICKTFEINKIEFLKRMASYL